jgi:hypothetical protein
MKDRVAVVTRIFEEDIRLARMIALIDGVSMPEVIEAALKDYRAKREKDLMQEIKAPTVTPYSEAETRKKT